MRYVLVGCFFAIFGCAPDPLAVVSQLPDGGRVPIPTGLECVTDSDCDSTELCNKGMCLSCEFSFEQVTLPEVQSAFQREVQLLRFTTTTVGDLPTCYLKMRKMRFQIEIRRVNNFVPLFMLVEHKDAHTGGRKIEGFTVDAFVATGEAFTIRGEWNGEKGIPHKSTWDISLVCDNCHGDKIDKLSITTRFQTDYLFDKGSGGAEGGQHGSIVQSVLFDSNLP